jgi:uncharacterized protein (DUF305 family)
MGSLPRIATGSTPICLHSPSHEREDNVRTVLIILALLSTSGIATGTLTDAPFVDLVNAAMSKMMAGMENAPTGDVDKDFVAWMVPHHQGAIDMAQAELLYGRNVRLRRIAEEIIVTQQQEIAAMRLAVGQPLPKE